MKKLQGHFARQLDILCTINEAHSTATQAAKDLVVRNGFASQGKAYVLKLRAHPGFHLGCGSPVARQQGLDFLAQFGITGARLVKQLLASCRV